jgi:hypothetical protein
MPKPAVLADKTTRYFKVRDDENVAANTLAHSECGWVVFEQQIKKKSTSADAAGQRQRRARLDVLFVLGKGPKGPKRYRYLGR